MIALAGADLVLSDRIVEAGSMVIEAGRIVEIRSGPAPADLAAASPALHHHVIVPGFIDVHVHGVDGVDVLDPGGGVGAMAATLPRYGVTAFCPTTVACRPAVLRRFLDHLRDSRSTPVDGRSRILPAHLESNFINPRYRGAQPVSCLRVPRGALAADGDGTFNWQSAGTGGGTPAQSEGDGFKADDILREIDRGASEVGIVTMAPELDGGMDLVRWLVAHGHRVAVGHSAASYDEALEAIQSGVRHATHLFNRMPPFHHREPGLVGAVLQRDDIAAEMICDGHHVHPAAVRMAVAAKGRSRVMAVTDGTAASGLPVGARARLGGQSITAGASAAFLDDGTLAGGVSTMDRLFRVLVEQVGCSLLDAATLCSTTPARELGLDDQGVLAVGASADLVVLDARLRVRQTYVAGQLIYDRPA